MVWETEALVVKGSKTGAQGIFVTPRGRPAREHGLCMQWDAAPTAPLCASPHFPCVVVWAGACDVRVCVHL